MRDKALQLLNMRMYSHAELVKKLCEKKYLSSEESPEAEIHTQLAERVVSRLEELGLLGTAVERIRFHQIPVNRLFDL